jgi:hypothetical protein
MERPRKPQPLAARARWRGLLGVLISVAALAANVRAQDVDSESNAAPTAEDTAAVTASPTRAQLTPFASLLAGGGVTSRTIRVPAGDGPRALATGLVPALAVRVYGRLQDASRFLGLRLSYQTSLGVHAAQTVPDLSLIASETHIRSHRFEAGLVPGMFLGDSPNSAALSLFVGYGLRALASVAEIRVPRFTLHGPLARIEVELPLIAGRLSLRFAPELQVVVGMTQQLRAAAGLGSTALAFGGEASARLQLAGPFAARLCYREAHARSTGHEGHVFEDIERYLTLELSFRYD